MKSSFVFRDQVNTLSSWFKLWTECEQTVALYSLLKRISCRQSKFLSYVLEQTLAESQEVKVLEHQANNAAYVCNLSTEHKDIAISKLVTLLPLLRPGNADAKTEYLQILPKIVNDSVEKNIHLEQCRQLISYALIHPAISTEERSSFTELFIYLDEHISNQPLHPTHKIRDNVPVHPFHAHSQHSSSLRPESNLGSAVGFQTQYTSSMSHSTTPPNHYRHHHNNTTNNKTIFTATTTTAAAVGSTNNNNKSHQQHDQDWRRATLSKRDSGVDLNGWNDSSVFRNGSGNQQHPPGSNSDPSVGGRRHAPLTVAHSAPPSVPQISGLIGSSSHCLAPPGRNRRCNSLTPPLSSPRSPDWLSDDSSTRGGVGGGYNQLISGDHAPLSSQSSSGSGSDIHTDEQINIHNNSFMIEGSGMKDVPAWLKSLRLHKYSYLFVQITYEEMMSLTEEILESQGVTKGARHKIVLSINKLKTRYKALQQLEKDIMETGQLRNSLQNLKQILMSPIKSYILQKLSDITKPSDDSSTAPDTGTDGHRLDADRGVTDENDIPGQFTKVMGKACTQLLLRPDDENCSLYLHLIDRCLSHEAFTETQKKRLLSWKQQCQKLVRSYPFKMFNDGNVHRAWLSGPTGRQFVPDVPYRHPKSQHHIYPSPMTSSIPLHQERNTFHNISMSTAPYCFNHPRTMINNSHTIIQKTKSLSTAQSISTPHIQQTQQNLIATEPEINNRLESLCLSMTEHALSDMNDKMSAYTVS